MHLASEAKKTAQLYTQNDGALGMSGVRLPRLHNQNQIQMPKCNFYILYSSSRDRFYIGISNDVEGRLNRHNSGHSKSTKSGVPWILVCTKDFDSKSEAMRREYFIKSQKSRRVEKYLKV